MKIIHQGTVIQSSFGVLDDKGNVIQTVNVGPNPDNPEDSLRILSLESEPFMKAWESLVATRDNLQEQADRQRADQLQPSDDGQVIPEPD